jgi:hypothetical protein
VVATRNLSRQQAGASQLPPKKRQQAARTPKRSANERITRPTFKASLSFKFIVS